MISPILPVYSRIPLHFVYGEGAYLYTEEKQRYLDFTSGIGVTSLGHQHPYLVDILSEQVKKLWHISNLYHYPEMERLARRLTEISGGDSVFFCNSGTEAVECMIKMVRKYFNNMHSREIHKAQSHFICFENAYHGRTLGALSAGDRPEARLGFEPLFQEFTHVPINNIQLVEEVITPKTAAIMIEPVQGDGGNNVATITFLQQLRTLCDARGLLLCIDEVQCGMGRTGRMFAYQHAEIMPDIIASAKALGNGFPLGACIAKEHVAKYMQPGMHGSTYGGNPLAMAVGNGVLDVMLTDGFLEKVTYIQEIFLNALRQCAGEFPHIIQEVRGKGLMCAFQLKEEVNNKEFAASLREKHLLTLPGKGNTVRFLPPLIIERAHVEEAMTAIKQVLTNFKE